MPRNRHTVEQIITKLRETEVALSKGQPVAFAPKDIPFPTGKHPNLRGIWLGNGTIHSRHSRSLLLELAR